MTDFEYMLKLFVNGAMGTKTDIDASCNIEGVIKTARDHNLYYSVLSAILMSEDSELNLPVERLSELRKELKNIRLKTYVRMMQLAEVLKQFEHENIPYAVLKGNTVAVLYADPYSRISGDIDLLVSPRDEKRALKLLLQNGFSQEKARTDDDKHGILVHPVIGLLELHVSLYNEDTGEVWFNDAKGYFDVEADDLVFRNLQKIEIDDMHFYTLEINKRIEFLFLHNVKHFILGGSSMRAVMDFFLTYVKCKDIDYALFFEKIRRMKFDVIYNVMIGAIEKFLPLDKLEVPFYRRCDDRLVELFLDDMDKGKWLGYSPEGESSNAWKVFEEEKREGAGLGNDSGKIKWLIRNIFPSVNRLKNNYRYSMKYPVLIPVAWIHRLLNFIFGKTKVIKEELNSEEASSRVELLKSMNMLK